jgi:hypothetical protein
MVASLVLLNDTPLLSNTGRICLALESVVFTLCSLGLSFAIPALTAASIGVFLEACLQTQGRRGGILTRMCVSSLDSLATFVFLGITMTSIYVRGLLD